MSITIQQNSFNQVDNSIEESLIYVEDGGNLNSYILKHTDKDGLIAYSNESVIQNQNISQCLTCFNKNQMIRKKKQPISVFIPKKQQITYQIYQSYCPKINCLHNQFYFIIDNFKSSLSPDYIFVKIWKFQLCTQCKILKSDHCKFKQIFSDKNCVSKCFRCNINIVGKIGNFVQQIILFHYYKRCPQCNTFFCKICQSSLQLFGYSYEQLKCVQCQLGLYSYKKWLISYGKMLMCCFLYILLGPLYVALYLIFLTFYIYYICLKKSIQQFQRFYHKSGNTTKLLLKLFFAFVAVIILITSIIMYIIMVLPLLIIYSINLIKYDRFT